ncbi:MAG: hypothetical protein MUO50_18425 [Longimicrobiales bacterium]|nr:hypothetical protein [Longimicrobiales bacterium]
MTTVIAIAVFGLLFALFALLGPAERSRHCGGRKAGEERCDKCPLSAAGQRAAVACPGGLKR